MANKKYRFTVLATTSKGSSLDPNFVEVITSSAEKPSKTNFRLIDTFEDGFNLTWSTMDQMNAASLFYVKYKKKDDVAAPWLRTALTTDNYMAVTGLESGTRYIVTLVATTGTEERSLETESDEEVLKTAGKGKKSICLLSRLIFLKSNKQEANKKENIYLILS